VIPRKYIDSANFDFNVKPSDNFYQYANGNWLRNNPIPPSESRWGSFSEIQEFNYKALHDLLNEYSMKANKAGSIEQKCADFFKSGMDSAMLEKRGYEDIKPDIARIYKITNTDDLINELCMQQVEGGNPVIGFYADQDAKNSTKIAAQLWQAGIGMPNRDYYFKDDERTQKIRDAYKTYFISLFKLIGEDQAEAKYDAVFALEKKLAGASKKPVELRDPEANYNKYSIGDLSKETANLNWSMILAKFMVPKQDSIIVGQPKYYDELSKQIKETSISDWKTYLVWHTVKGSAPYLSNAFVQANFSYSGKALSGQKEMKPRWKRVLATVDGGLGEALGQLYVNKYFDANAKSRMLTLVKNLQVTFGERIKALDWMSQPTKDKALKKLSGFMLKIGYPDKWRDYSSVAIVPDSYSKNLRAIGKFEYKRMIAKIGKPIDKTEWGMSPPTVNAYYNPGFNEIVFPAGILHFPFFDFGADDAVNYGGIGAVIGHEMTHGFDDQGSQYDAEGNLKSWWTDEDRQKFEAKTGVVVNQFNNYTVLDTVHVNGSLTLGENIADLGGLSISYNAFLKTDQAKKGQKIAGFTPEQRFFLSWAQIWRANITDEAAMLRINTDPHSPGKYRCNGPLSNFPEFYKAFNVKENDPMWRPENERAKIW
jgi:putative endopeptidase